MGLETGCSTCEDHSLVVLVSHGRYLNSLFGIKLYSHSSGNLWNEDKTKKSRVYKAERRGHNFLKKKSNNSIEFCRLGWPDLLEFRWFVK